MSNKDLTTQETYDALRVVIEYCTKFKPHHDFWRYMLAELGFGGICTAGGLVLASRVEKAVVQGLVKPKFGSVHLVAALTLIEAIYEVQQVPREPALPRLRLAADPGEARLTAVPMSYAVSLIWAAGSLLAEDPNALTPAFQSAVRRLTDQVAMAAHELLRQGDSNDADALIDAFTTGTIVVRVPEALLPSRQPALRDWARKFVEPSAMIPIAVRWCGVLVAPLNPKLGIKLTGANLILPELDMEADSIIDVAAKVAGRAFDALVAFIEELLHWRVVRETAAADGPIFEVLTEPRPFMLEWDTATNYAKAYT